jgi:hypothetical protein
MRTRRSTRPPSPAPAAPFDGIARWRRDRLIAAGFAPGLAADLARERYVDLRVDLHALLELIDRGCPPELAARILAPLDES